MEQEEFILCAAVDYKGTIVSGFRHGDCYNTIKSLTGDMNPNDRDIEGFITSKDRFVGREEAWKIAKKMKQIVFGYAASNWDDYAPLYDASPYDRPVSILISENLY